MSSVSSPEPAPEITDNSLSVNGTNSYLEAPNSTSLNLTGPLTVEAWFKVNVITNSYQSIVARFGDPPNNDGGYLIYLTNTGKALFATLRNGGDWDTITGATTVTTSQWHHVAGVFDGTQMRIYLDGVLDGSKSSTSAPVSGTQFLRIGAAGTTASGVYSYFNGLIDEVRVSTGVIYSNGFTPSYHLNATSSTRGLWKFDGESASDTSTNGNNGALHNSALYSLDVPEPFWTNVSSNLSVTNGTGLTKTGTAYGWDDGAVSVKTISSGDCYVEFTAAELSHRMCGLSNGDSNHGYGDIDFALYPAGIDQQLYVYESGQLRAGPLGSYGPSDRLRVSVEGGVVKYRKNGVLLMTSSVAPTYPLLVDTSFYTPSATISNVVFVQSNNQAPTVSITSPANNAVLTAGSNITITASATDSDGSVTLIEFFRDAVKLGEINPPSSSFTWTNAPAGNYALTARATDNLGAVTTSAPINVTVNQPPTANPGGSYSGTTGTGIGFNGSGSSDPDGTITGYAWNLGDNTSGNGATVTHTYATSGNYTVTLTVTDNNGATNSATVTATIANRPPVANAGGPYSGTTGTGVQFIGSGSSDPDGTIAAYAWNFGDNTSGTGSSPTHIYAGGGSYTVTLTVTDNNGATNSATASVTITGFANARLDPLNRTGEADEDPLSRNFSWNLPLLNLPGRNELDVNIGLSYNSLVWTRSGNYISFNDDHGFPGPGFRLGFPVIQPAYFNSETNKTAYLLITPGGSRTELRQVGTSALFEAADSSHLLLDTSNGEMILRTTAGTQLSYGWMGSDYQCTRIKDSNGNYITVNYVSGRIDTVVDTLARTIKFNYNEANELSSITQTWTVNGQPTQHTWASFAYINQTIQTNFPNLIILGPQNGSTIRALSQVTLADGSHYNFDYNSWGQVWKVSNYAADNHLRNYHSYNLPSNNSSALNDCPRFSERHDWAENWNRTGANGASGLPSGSEQEVNTAYAIPVAASWTLPDGTQQSGLVAQVTLPDFTYQKIYYAGTAGTGSGWSRGVASLVETFDSAGNRQRQAVTSWTQDNTNVSYPLNPRVTETNIYDPAGNRARTSVTYQHFDVGDGTACELPQNVYEYQADATTVLRYTHTAYNTNSAYTSRRIIGLVSEKSLYDVDPNTQAVKLMSKVGFQYDETGSLVGNDAPIQHDNSNYSVSFLTGRANISSVKRYNVDNTDQFTTNSIKYNTAGAAVLTVDALGHQNAIAYGDSFSDGNNGRNTLAYPTTVTDGDNFSSSLKYNFDFGALTWKQTPLPNATTNQPGPQQTFEYDNIGRLLRVTNSVNSAYSRFVYGANYVETWSTVNTAADEAHSLKVFDGLGRVIATASNHPGSFGGFSGQLTLFDAMGRAVKSSNPTETSVSISGVIQPYDWSAVGDDSTAGWIYTQQTYDWKGRPLVTTNPSVTSDPTQTTHKDASYSGCGCAGGEVVTLTDEGTIDAGVPKRRQQRVYSDVLGRTVKTELLNWQGGSVYATTVNTYNARDQLTLVRQFQGEGPGNLNDLSCPTGTCQQTTTTYDGYGRLKTKHVPQQQVDSSNSASTDHTTWAYNDDDTIASITDARGASQTFAYSNNNRQLVSGITYAAPSGVPVPASVSFGYDAAGNRKSMNDGFGTVDYTYNQLSALSYETRTFSDPSNPSINGVVKTLGYDYNLAGELKTLTDPSGAIVTYTNDNAGRLTRVDGSGYGDFSWFASNIQYRAWGGLKHLDYENGVKLDQQHDGRLRLTRYALSSQNYGESWVNRAENYQYYSDSRVKFMGDEADNRFDRAYGYDQAGQLTQALTGGEARGQEVWGPYKETFQYDRWGNTTGRYTRHWGYTHQYAGISFTNNRSDNYAYDADGRVLVSYIGVTAPNRIYYQYDARGQKVEARLGNNANVVNHGFDGDGQWIKVINTKVENSVTTPATGYEVRSSVLGGQVIQDLNAQGTKTQQHVYTSGGSELAAGNAETSMIFKHIDPVTGTEQLSWTNGQNNGRTELDPVGGDVGLQPPDVEEPDADLPTRHGSLGQPANRCADGGMSSDCNSLMLGGYDPIAFWDTRIADLPGFGTTWGSMVELGARRHALQVAENLAFYISERREGNVHPTDYLMVEAAANSGSFADCFRSSGLATAAFRDPGDPKHRWMQSAAEFWDGAADMLLEVSQKENVSLPLLAVTWMNESSFHMRPAPQNGSNDPSTWDYGPFQLNKGYIESFIAIWNKTNGRRGISNKELPDKDIFGQVADKNFGFDGSPLANGRMAARLLLATGGKDDRQRAQRYTSQVNQRVRGISYDNYAGLFQKFFDCYRGGDSGGGWK